MQNNYQNHSVRSPYQPHPVQQMYERSMDMQDSSNPVRQMLQKLCQTRYSLSASFSPDLTTMSALKTSGLVAVKCDLSLDGKLVGIGHGSTVISKFNRGLDRALYSCLNGALMSAINSACKTLDVIRLEGIETQPVSVVSPKLGEAYRTPKGEEAEPATEKQKAYLRELILLNCEDDTERQEYINQLGELTKKEASEQIQALAK